MSCRFLWVSDIQQCFLINKKERVFYRVVPDVCKLLEAGKRDSSVQTALQSLGCGRAIVHRVKSSQYFANLNLHVTERCNLRCKFCYMGDSTYKNEIPKNLIFSILNEFFELGGVRVILTGGEPFLHPHLVEIARHVNRLGMRLIAKTNGTSPLLPRYAEMFDEIHISMFGDRAVYREISGRDMFDIVVAHLAQLLERRSQTGKPEYVQLTFTVVPENVKLLEGISNLYPFNRQDVNVIINPPIYSGLLRYKYPIAETKQIREQIRLYKNKMPSLQRNNNSTIVKYFPVQTCNTHTLTVIPPDKLVYCPFLKDIVYAHLGIVSLAEAIERIAPINHSLSIPEKVKEVGKGECLANHYFYNPTQQKLISHSRKATA